MNDVSRYMSFALTIGKVPSAANPADGAREQQLIDPQVRRP